MSVLGIQLKNFTLFVAILFLAACDQGYRFAPDKNSGPNGPGKESSCAALAVDPVLDVPSFVEVNRDFTLSVDNPRASWNLSGPNYVRSLFGASHTLQVQRVGTYNGIVTILDACERVITLNFSFQAVEPVTSPTIAINNNDIYTNDSNVSLSLSAVNANEMYITNDSSCATGGSWQAYATAVAWDLSNLNQNSNVYVKYRNGFGSESICVSDNIVHDDIAPVAIFARSPGPISTGNNLEFEFSSVENGSGVFSYNCALDSANPTQCPTTQVLNGLTDGSHTMNLLVLDKAGNTSGWQQYTWVVDTTAPVLNLTQSPNPITNESLAEFAFTASDLNGVRRFECSLDGQSFQNCTSPTNYNVGEGKHSFSVRAFDIVGNVSAEVKFSWQVDLSLPIVTIFSGPTSPTNSTDAIITFDVNDNVKVDKIECKFDNGSYSSCSNPFTLSGLSNGNHSVQIRAFDSAGNESVPASYSWQVDTVGPSISITSFPANPTRDQNASFEFSAQDVNGVAGIYCSIDGAKAVSCTSPAAYSALTEGIHTFEVYAVDTLGNIGTPSFYRWDVQPNSHETEFTIAGPQKRADIIVVMDNSDSMRPRMYTMGERFTDFLDVIGDVDWRIGVITSDAEGDREWEAGRLVPIHSLDSSRNFITKDDPNYVQVFMDTVQREERGSNHWEEPIRAIRLATQRPENQNFFREDAELITIIVTDADEHGGRIRNIPKENRPENLVRYMDRNYPERKYTNHTLSYQPSSSFCNIGPGGQHGLYVENLAHFTRGLIGTVCEVRYWRALRGWERRIGTSMKTSYKLDCEPENGVVDITYTPAPANLPNTSVVGDRLKFHDLPPLGTKVKVAYRCP